MNVLTCSSGMHAADLSVQDEFDVARRQGRDTESLLMDTSLELAKVKRDNVLLMQQVRARCGLTPCHMHCLPWHCAMYTLVIAEL